MALRWLIENESVIPIPGAKNGKQAADNAGALSFCLETGEMDALDRATRWLAQVAEPVMRRRWNADVGVDEHVNGP